VVLIVRQYKRKEGAAVDRIKKGRVIEMSGIELKKPKNLADFMTLNELKPTDPETIESLCEIIEEAIKEHPKWAKYLRDRSLSPGRLSKNQRMILEILKQQPILNTKSIAELVFLKVIKHRSKEYSSTHRSLRSLEKKGLVERVHGWQLRKVKPEKWRKMK